MDPIRRVKVVAFLDWIRRTHSEVQSLSALSHEEFMRLAGEFENSKGRKVDPSDSVFYSWGSTHMWFRHSGSDEEAIQSLPS
jgi:hypothetical protein